jgi:hypothetical protein
MVACKTTMASNPSQAGQGTGGALYPLGTWHNHLVTSGSSGKDMRTGILLSRFQYFPLLLLIHTPGRLLIDGCGNGAESS